MCFDIQKYVYSESMFKIHCDKTEMLQKFPLDKISLQNMPSLFHEPKNLWFLYELKHKVRLSKTVCGLFHFRFRLVFVNFFIFVQQNAGTLWL